MNTSKIKLEEEKQPTIENDSLKKNKKEKAKKDHTRLFLALKIIGLIIILLSISRAPYCGSYIDGLFDYIFGQVKYVFYVWSIFVLINLIYGGRLSRIVKTRRFIIFSAVSFLCIGCIISGSYDFVKYLNKSSDFATRMSQYHQSWFNYFTTTNYSNYFNTCISGGILAVLLSSIFNLLSYFVLIVLAAIILLISIFIIFNINYKSTKIGLKLRGWMVRKLGGTFKYDGYNELSDNHLNQNKFHKHKKSEIEASAAVDGQINFDLLPETQINNDDKNFRKAATYQAKLASLFKQEEINCVPSDVNIYASFSEICFDAKTNSDIKKIINIQDKISNVLKLDKFNISYRGNILAIDYDNIHYSKLSLKSISSLAQRKPLTTFFGMDKYKALSTQDFKLSPNALIVGKKGSGSATLTVLMALTMCFNTAPDLLDLVILNPNAEQTYAAFYSMPHSSGKVYENINVVSEKLHELQSIVNQRNSLLSINNVDNIDQFNKINTNSTNRMKYVLVVIPNVENCIKETFQNSKIIEDLLVNGPKVGIYTILQSYSVNNEITDPGIYNSVTDKYVFTLEDKNQSVKLLNSARANQLHSNGDCLHFVKDKVKGMERLQVCSINQSELFADVDLAKTFYSVKKEQAEAEILEEPKDEKKII